MAGAVCTGSQKKPPRNAAAKILDMASRGVSKAGIARGVGASPKLLNAWLDKYPKLQEAFDEGREREHGELFGALYDSAKDGNVTAAIFLLKTRHGYREGDQGDLVVTNRILIARRPAIARWRRC